MGAERSEGGVALCRRYDRAATAGSLAQNSDPRFACSPTLPSPACGGRGFRKT